MADQNNIDISSLSQKEIKHLAVLLLKNIVLPKQGLEADLFNALARITVTMAVETVALRINAKTKKIEVYLTQRSPHETAYPGQWHCPGTVMRRMEEIDDMFLRLEKREFGIKILSKKFIAHFNNPKETRGHFFTLLYLCVLEEGTGLGHWFPVAKLPENTPWHHRKTIIPAAVKKFTSNK